MKIYRTLVQDMWYDTEESDKNVFWINQLDWVEDSTQQVLNVHMSLKWWTWVYDHENNIETVL